MLLGRLAKGILISRPNRFGAWIQVDGERLYVYVPNTGRLREILVPGAPVRWLPKASEERKTVGDLIVAARGETWIGVDARMPPRVLAEAMMRPGGIAPFGRACCDPVFEPPLGEGRADLLITCGRTQWIIETKSATLYDDGVALFPDAETPRGTRHLHELADLAAARAIRGGRGGLRPAVAFICQRPDVYSFTPNAPMDPTFAGALAEARGAGVAVLAYRCDVSPREVRVAERIPARLGRLAREGGG